MVYFLIYIKERKRGDYSSSVTQLKKEKENNNNKKSIQQRNNNINILMNDSHSITIK